MRILTGILLSSAVAVASIAPATASDADYRRGFRDGMARTGVYGLTIAGQAYATAPPRRGYRFGEEPVWHQDQRRFLDVAVGQD